MSVIPVILSSFILSTLSVDFVAEEMTCYDAGTPGTSKWDANLLWTHDGYYFNGMESYHDNSYEDRRTIIRFCKTNSGSNHDEQILPFTQYDASWKRGCGGGSAIYRAFSRHNNDYEDRQFEFRCSVPSDDFILGSCEWIGYYPANFDGSIHKDCANSGVMRTIESYHDNSHEDRKFRFECCIVYQNPYNYTSMIFSANDFYSNEWNGPHDVIKQGYFLSGMESYHSNSREDRRFKWQFCKPSSGSYISEAVMDETSYDSRFFRSCSVYNGGNAAMIRAKSYHDNDYEDRRWTFTCGLLDNEEYDLVNCGWTGNLNEYDGELDFHCPNNGVIRGIHSWHNDVREDRIWRIDCCNIAERDYEFTNIEGYWKFVGSAGGSGSISSSITTGIKRSNGQDVTNEYSQELSVAVSVGFEFGLFGISGSVGIEITGTVASSTATTISQSFTSYEEHTVSITCDSGVQYLYQFVMEADQATVNTYQYRCTNVPNPKCAPGFFDCQAGDPNCNTCKSSWPSQ
eukprot:85059_1